MAPAPQTKKGPRASPYGTKRVPSPDRGLVSPPPTLQALLGSADILDAAHKSLPETYIHADSHCSYWLPPPETSKRPSQTINCDRNASPGVSSMRASFQLTTVAPALARCSRCTSKPLTTVSQTSP